MTGRMLLCFGLAALAACSESKPPPAEPAAKSEPEATASPIAESSPAQAGIPVLAGPYAPKDECITLAGAAKFRAALVKAVSARDVETFLALAEPDIEVGFGGGGGVADLRTKLRGEAGSALWEELDRLLALGCASDRDGTGEVYLSIPGLLTKDFGDLDMFEAHVVLGENVPLLPRPDASAPPIRLLSWYAVSIANDKFVAGAPFQQVKIPAGNLTGPLNLTGYVETAKLRSVIDYRLVMERRGGDWKIAAFLAGD